MSKISAKVLVEKFNLHHPVGSTVMWRSDSVTAKFAPYEVRHEAYIASSGHAVAFLKGVSGYVSIEPQFCLIGKDCSKEIKAED